MIIKVEIYYDVTKVGKEAWPENVKLDLSTFVKEQVPKLLNFSLEDGSKTKYRASLLSEMDLLERIRTKK